LSRRFFKRENEHLASFDTFKVVFIGETDNCEQIEQLFEDDLKKIKLRCNLTINRKNQSELL